MSTIPVIPVVLDALSAAIPDVPVGTERPADAAMTPGFELIRVVAAGGPGIEDEVIDWADITWEAWAAGDSGARAEQIAAQVVDAFYAMNGHHGGGYVAAGESTRGRDFPDQTTKTPRYVGQARVLIHAIS